MKSHILASLSVLALIILYSSHTTLFARPFKKEIRPKEIMYDLYKDISGFDISNEEFNSIMNHGDAAAYGEIKYESLEKLLTDLSLTKDDVFYDLGCGLGKVCVQTALATPVKKSIGIELSSTRVKHAQGVKKRLHRKRLIGRGRLDFHEQNITDAKLNDATVIFMCSTCFSEKLMQTVTNKLAQLNDGLRILTLKSLPKNPPFTLVKEYTLPMTWSESSPVYLYRLEKKR